MSRLTYICAAALHSIWDQGLCLSQDYFTWPGRELGENEWMIKNISIPSILDQGTTLGSTRSVARPVCKSVNISFSTFILYDNFPSSSFFPSLMQTLPFTLLYPVHCLVSGCSSNVISSRMFSPLQFALSSFQILPWLPHVPVTHSTWYP